MDREKMIEELLSRFCEDHGKEDRCMQSGKKCADMSCAYRMKAVNVINKHIPDGAVVLTREEYDRFEETIKDTLCKKEEYIKGLIELGKERQDIRKETAREIWLKGKELYKKYDDKDIAINMLAAWIENNFGLEVE